MIKRAMELLNRIYIYAYIYMYIYICSLIYYKCEWSGAILFLPFYRSKLFEHAILQSLLSALDFSLCIL